MFSELSVQTISVTIWWFFWVCVYWARFILEFNCYNATGLAGTMPVQAFEGWTLGKSTSITFAQAVNVF